MSLQTPHTLTPKKNESNKRARWRQSSSTYRDQDAVGVFKLLRLVTDNLSQTLHVAHSDDADVVVEAEGLDEGEVDLESDVTLELRVRGQHAEGHAVRVTVDKEERPSVSYSSLM